MPRGGIGLKISSIQKVLLQKIVLQVLDRYIAVGVMDLVCQLAIQQQGTAPQIVQGVKVLPPLHLMRYS